MLSSGRGAASGEGRTGQNLKLQSIRRYDVVASIQVLLEYGGIYLDLDVLVTRPFDELRRRFPCTIGREQPTKACGSVIVCSRHSPFLLLWINSYIDDYRIEEWAYNTGQVNGAVAASIRP